MRASILVLLLVSMPVGRVARVAAAQTAVRTTPTGRMSPADQTALHRALDAYDAGDSKSAAPALVTLTRRYPGNYEANEALGSLYAEAGNFADALPLLKRAAALAPSQSLARANLGATYLKLGRLPEALPELQQAVALDPANPASQKNLGQALMLAHQPAAAAAAFAHAAAGLPDDTSLRYDWALALYDAGNAQESAAALEAIPAASANDQVNELAGDANERSGHYEQALLHFEAGAHQNPSDANLYALLGELMRHWTWAEAIQVAQFGAERYPQSRHFRLAEGIAQFGKGDFPAAVETFAALLEATPNDETVADLLGRSCGALADGEYPRCHGVYAFAERHPNDVVMTTYAAIALLHAPGTGENLDRAEALLRTAIARDPNYAEAYLRLGMLDQVRLRWAASAVMLERAVALDPDSPEAHYRLSRAYAHLGRRDDAKTQSDLHQSCAAKAKATTDARMQEVVKFVLTPG